jgi:flagellar motor switch protein FliM
LSPPATADDNRDEVVWADGSPVSDLLGFDLGADGVDRSGLSALVNSALVSHRRLPMLDVVFDRAARRFSSTLRQLANENADVALDNISSARFGDFLQAQSPFGVIGVMRSAPLHGAMLIAADPVFTHQAIDLLLGGRRSAGREEERALTAIELAVAQRLMQALTADVDEAFRPVENLSAVLERIETSPRFAAIAQETSVCAVAKFKVRLGERHSRLTVYAPYATLEAIEEKLRRGFTAEAGAIEASWRETLASGVGDADLNVAAVLADRVMRIGEVQRLAVGDTLTLGSAGDPRVELRVGAAAVAAGRIGKHGASIAIRLDTPIDSRAAALAAEAAQ